MERRECDRLKSLLNDCQEQLRSAHETVRQLRDTLSQTEIKLRETEENCRKSRARSEELLRQRREIENVLVEQDKSVTHSEERLKHIEKVRNVEKEQLEKAVEEHSATIVLLRHEREQQLTKITLLENEVDSLKASLMKSHPANKDALAERDNMIGRLKALVRENKATAENLRGELLKMNEEASDKNKSIAHLRKSCHELSVKCSELENALCASAAAGNASYPSAEGPVGNGANAQDLSALSKKGSTDVASLFSEHRSVMTTMRSEESVERGRCDADEGHHQEPVDFNTWSMHYGFSHVTSDSNKENYGWFKRHSWVCAPRSEILSLP